MTDEWINYKGDKLTSPEQVKGHNKLSDSDKRLFTEFLQHFYKAWEYPEDHLPIKVEAAKGYLKVTFNDMWLHVLNASTWY